MEGESARRKGEWLAAAGDPRAAAWLAGAEGERRVAAALAGMPSGWTVVHDRLLMPGLAESNLDHVLVGAAGVVLVDAKNFSGEITVWNDSLYQHLGRGESRSSRNLIGELRKVHWMAAQMGARLALPVLPVLCLAGNRSERFGEPQLVCGVWVVPVGSLVAWLASRAARMEEAEAVRTVPRVLSEFPSTMTDPELLTAIGRDLGKSGQTAVAHPERRRRVRGPGPAHVPPPPTRGASRRRSLWRLVRLVIVVVVLVWGVQNIAAVSGRAGEILAAVLTRGLVPEPAAPAPASDMSVAPAETDADDPAPLSCEALSADRLSAYVAVPVTAWHREDGSCMWVSDPADPRSVVLTAEQLSERTVAHLPGDSVSLSASGSLNPPGPTSVLIARAGQWIPVADTRTVARWPMRVEIRRGLLGIDDQRGQQILRAVAADLNAPAG